jgi:ABC-type cobalamin/Fe3+-siderophores transport system ATPase subunit
MRVGGAEATRFVGRKLELQLLADELAAAKAGHGNLCVLSGEAGIGKTRLLREFARKEWASGALFVQGRFRESGEADSGGVWNRSSTTASKVL